MAQAFPLVIAGGGSFVAPYLMQRLHARGLLAEVISRHPVQVPDGFKFTQLDFEHARNWIAPENAVIISLLPLPCMAQFMPRFIGVKAIVAVGSASHFIKVRSKDPKEQSSARNVDLAESILRTWCTRCNVQHVLLRGAMIYDGAHDYNVVRMARFIRRYHFLPLAAPATGLRQPIHADDVAKAIVGCLNNDAVYDKVLNIAGGEVLTYRAMTERIFEALDMKPRLWMLRTSSFKERL